MTKVMLYVIALCVGCGLPTVAAVETGATASASTGVTSGVAIATAAAIAIGM